MIADKYGEYSNVASNVVYRKIIHNL